MSKWYPLFLQATLELAANSDVEAGTVKYALLTSSYVYSDAHDFYDDVVANVVGTPVTLSAKTFTAGTFNATVPDYSGTGLAGAVAAKAVIFLDTGTPATSRLLYFIDDSPQFPFTFLELNPGAPTGNAANEPIVLSGLPLAISSGSGNDIWYPLFLQALFERPANSALSGTLKVVGLKSTYTYSAAHDFLDDIPAPARTGTPQTIGSKTYVNGVLDGADVTFPASPGLAGMVAAAVYLDTGVEATSMLVALKRNIQGLPVGGLTTTIAQPYNWSAVDGVMKLGAATA